MHKQLKIFGILNILDIILTYIALEHNTNVSELNPIASIIFEQIGTIYGLLFLKIIGFMLMLELFNYFYNKYPKSALNTIKIINIFYVFIVLNNLYQNLI